MRRRSFARAEPVGDGLPSYAAMSAALPSKALPQAGCCVPLGMAWDILPSGVSPQKPVLLTTGGAVQPYGSQGGHNPKKGCNCGMGY